MKNIILGTTALVAAATMTTGFASAAEKKQEQRIKLSVGGYLLTSFVAANYDNDGFLPTNMRNEGEIHFKGRTKLDNGLEFGVNVQLEARQDSDQIDETFMYVHGAFGRIVAGSENDAAYLMHYSSPQPVIAWDLETPGMYASGFTRPATAANEVSDKDKFTYFTPRISGFQVGASFTPDANWETGQSSPFDPVGIEGAKEEAYSIGANYVNKFNEVSLKTSIGYATITSTTANDIEEISVGMQVGYAGLTVGGGYKLTENDGGVDDQERHDFNFGATYGQGPWQVGVQYARVELDDASEGVLDAVVVGGNYILGPGVTVFGGVQYFSGEDALVGTAGDEATIFFVGTALSF